LEEALRELQTAISQTGSGYIVLRTDSPEVTKAIQEKARSAGAHFNTDTFENNATINILVGKTKEFFLKARSAYIQAIDIKPTYPKPYVNLGALYMKIGQRNIAVDYLENAYRLDPRDKELEEYLNQLR
jgi:tetratricopeptide (TPR) repeat protein